MVRLVGGSAKAPAGPPTAGAFSPAGDKTMSNRIHANGTNGTNGQDTKPSSNGSNGRGPGGKFAPGNKYGKGNPFVQRLTANRGLFLEIIDPEKLKVVITKLYYEARAGNIEATKIILYYCVGKPQVMAEAADDDADDGGES